MRKFHFQISYFGNDTLSCLLVYYLHIKRKLPSTEVISADNIMLSDGDDTLLFGLFSSVFVGCMQKFRQSKRCAANNALTLLSFWWLKQFCVLRNVTEWEERLSFYFEGEVWISKKRSDLEIGSIDYEICVCIGESQSKPFCFCWIYIFHLHLYSKL